MLPSALHAPKRPAAITMATALRSSRLMLVLLTEGGFLTASALNAADQYTHTTEPRGMRPFDQIQSMAALLTRTHPWEAG